MVQDLEEAGLAYESNGSWYFRVGKKEGYGQQYGLFGGWKTVYWEGGNVLQDTLEQHL